MAAPSTPTNLILQTANGADYLTWDAVTASPVVTAYQVQRSTDGVSYTILASPTLPEYLDEAATVNTLYYYRVAATNSDGTGTYTAAQSCVPTESGEMSLGQIRLYSQQRADKVNSDFVTLPEWNSLINQSLFELYDLLVTIYGDNYFVAEPLEFNTNGTDANYALPNGTNYSGAAPFYKLIGVDLGVNTGPNGWVNLPKFNFANRNQYFYPNTNSTAYGIFNMSYRIVGSKINFIPLPSGNQPIRLWYVPRLRMLLKDSDVTTASVSGWIEYVIVDAAIKALQKEESDVSALMLQKEVLRTRIMASAANVDAGAPDTISNTRGQGWGGYEGGPEWYKGGF